MGDDGRPKRNRVTPFGSIEAHPSRGSFMGNRGCIHAGFEITRPYAGRRWIICDLSAKQRTAPQWAEGCYTVLFFHDEAVALAAGHRPCSGCRRSRYNDFMKLWRESVGPVASAENMDAALHQARLDGSLQRRHRMPWVDVPDGAFVTVDQTPHLVHESRLWSWSPGGYGQAVAIPEASEAEVLTPAPTTDVLRAGYRPLLALP